MTEQELKEIIQEEFEAVVEAFDTDKPIKQLDLYGKDEIPLTKLRAKRSEVRKQQEKYKKKHDGKANPKLTTKLKRMDFAIRSRTDWGKVDEDAYNLEERKKKKKKSKKKKKLDRCARIAKRKYKVWPSAYASGAAVKCRKGKIWKGVKEGEEPIGEKKDKGESLRKWFGRKGAPGKQKGWVDCNAPKYKKGKKVGYKSCGRQKDEKRSKYPACRPTAAQCKSKGKGKKWGKKAAKESLDMKLNISRLTQAISEELHDVVEAYFYIPEACYDDGSPAMVEFYEGVIEEAEYRGRKVKLNKPMRGDVKKFKVYVKDPKTGNVKKVNFGDPNMRIRKSNPKARKSFRARHKCKTPGPKTKARYWSCKKW